MEELGPSTVVATGGFSSLIAPYSDTIEHVEPWLTLHGLRIVYERNVSGVVSEPATRLPLPLRAHAPGGRDRRGVVGARPREESGVTVAVAGRLMLLRPQGKLAFAELRDASGSIQLFALAAVTARFDEFARLNLGDWIGARGEVVRTKRGELSVKVSEWELLAQARRNFGDKWHGVTDIETRYRQREVDLWANERSRQIMQLRSDVVRHMRGRLWDQGFVEVETPLLHPIAGRRDGPAVRHAPQRARHRLLPARGARALPQAARRGRVRQGVRDRPHLPQRRPLAPAQPRVHDARALPGLRRLPRHHGRVRGVGGGVGPRRARNDGAHLRRPPARPHARRGAAPRWPN